MKIPPTPSKRMTAKRRVTKQYKWAYARLENGWIHITMPSLGHGLTAKEAWADAAKRLKL